MTRHIKVEPILLKTLHAVYQVRVMNREAVATCYRQQKWLHVHVGSHRHTRYRLTKYICDEGNLQVRTPFFITVLLSIISHPLNLINFDSRIMGVGHWLKLSALCERASNEEFSCYLCCLPKQAVKQIDELSVIEIPKRLCDVSVDSYDGQFIFCKIGLCATHFHGAFNQQW